MTRSVKWIKNVLLPLGCFSFFMLGATGYRLRTPESRLIGQDLVVVVSSRCGHAVRMLARIEASNAARAELTALPLDPPDSPLGKRACDLAEQKFEGSWRRIGLDRTELCAELHRIAKRLHDRGTGVLPGWFEDEKELLGKDWRLALASRGLDELAEPTRSEAHSSETEGTPRAIQFWRGQDIGF